MPDPRLTSSVGDPALAHGINSHSGTIQRACASCSAEYTTAEEKNRPVHSANLCPKCRTQGQGLIQAKPIAPLIQTKTTAEATPEVTPAISSSIQSLQGGGRPLSGAERGFFEPRFGANFSGVRVHDDARAAGVARSVNARAFTVGRDVVFGGGEYSSDSMAGRQLLAHELTHTIQQRTDKSSSVANHGIQREDNTLIHQSTEVSDLYIAEKQIQKQGIIGHQFQHEKTTCNPKDKKMSKIIYSKLPDKNTVTEIPIAVIYFGTRCPSSNMDLQHDDIDIINKIKKYPLFSKQRFHLIGFSDTRKDRTNKNKNLNYELSRRRIKAVDKALFVHMPFPKIHHPLGDTKSSANDVSNFSEDRKVEIWSIHRDALKPPDRTKKEIETFLIKIRENLNNQSSKETSDAKYVLQAYLNNIDMHIVTKFNVNQALKDARKEDQPTKEFERHNLNPFNFGNGLKFAKGKGVKDYLYDCRENIFKNLKNPTKTEKDIRKNLSGCITLLLEGVNYIGSVDIASGGLNSEYPPKLFDKWIKNQTKVKESIYHEKIKESLGIDISN